jgi:hypothetical protein
MAVSRRFGIGCFIGTINLLDSMQRGVADGGCSYGLFNGFCCSDYLYSLGDALYNPGS